MQVFCYVAQRMTTEGSEKTWDQCRIKLKNLKSQYRYVKDRIPNIDEVDLEDDEVIFKKYTYYFFNSRIIDHTGCPIWIVTKVNKCCEYVFGVRFYAGNMCTFSFLGSPYNFSKKK